MNLTGATLGGDWRDSNLTNVNLTNADLRGMGLGGGVVLTGVTYSNTTCADGTNSSAHVPQSCAGQGRGW